MSCPTQIFSKFIHLILLISLQGYLYSLSTLMVYMVYGVYVTIRDGCVTEIQSTVDEGDFFGTVKNGCICNPWVAFAGKMINTQSCLLLGDINYKKYGYMNIKTTFYVLFRG